jgi:hypothetical protein
MINKLTNNRYPQNKIIKKLNWTNNNNNSSPFVTSGSARIAKPKAMILLLFGLVTMSIVLAKLEIVGLALIFWWWDLFILYFIQNPIVGFIQPLT